MKPATGERPPLLTLTTDFGEGSPYVAALKGVILRLLPAATIVDVTHSVPPFDVRSGAFLLWAGTRDFPPAAVHLVVVDPGVGGTRRRLGLEMAGGRRFVGPDNGVFDLVLQEEDVRAAVELPRPEAASATFEGRDVFAPCAARLAAGERLADVGSPAVAPISRPAAGGRVIWIDNFGNLVTNLKPPLSGVVIGGRPVPAAARTFAEAPPAEPFWYVGSLGYVEVGLREGRADRFLGMGVGAPAEGL